MLEIFFGLYGCIAIFISIFSGNPVFVPIIAVQTIGFIYIAYLSIVHSSIQTKQSTLKKDVQTKRINDSSTASRVSRADIQTTDRLNTTVSAKTMIRKGWNKSNGGKKLGTEYYRITLAGILGFIIFGASMAYYGYQNTIYPLDKAAGYLSRAESSQTAGGLIDYIKHVKQFVPKEGNPVWSFTTPKTDFGLIQNDLDAMLARAISVHHYNQIALHIIPD